MNNHLDTLRDEIVSLLDAYWSERMTVLVDENRISDADALFSEYVIDGEEPEEWLFMEEV